MSAQLPEDRVESVERVARVLPHVPRIVILDALDALDAERTRVRAGTVPHGGPSGVPAAL